MRGDKNRLKMSRFVWRIAVKQNESEALGSRRSKSGSIYGNLRLGHHDKTRTNALRSGKRSAKFGFYRKKKDDLTRSEREHDRRETRTRAFLTRKNAKSGSIYGNSRAATL